MTFETARAELAGLQRALDEATAKTDSAYAELKQAERDGGEVAELRQEYHRQRDERFRLRAAVDTILGRYPALRGDDFDDLVEQKKVRQSYSGF